MSPRSGRADCWVTTFEAGANAAESLTHSGGPRRVATTPENGATTNVPPRGSEIGPAAVLALQRAAGNAAVGRVLVGRAPVGQALVGQALVGRAPVGGVAVGPALGQAAVQRDSGVVTVQRAPGPVGPVRVNNTRISVPIPAAASLQAAVPTGQSVTWSLVAGTAAIDPGSTIDASGLVTLGGSQGGGRIKVKAADSGGSGSTYESPVGLMKAPGSIASTRNSGAVGGANYGAKFRHTFAAVGGGTGSECEGVRVNEIFSGIPTPMATAHAMTTPFGAFTLKTNDPAAITAGWVINTSGEMGGDDHVSIGNGVDIRPLVKNTSNPTPADSLPAKFSAVQDLRSMEVPTNTYGAAFASPSHVRGLREPSAGAPEFFVSANGLEHVDKYVGKPAVRNAAAASPTVVASEPPAPKPKKGPAPAKPAPTTVQITAESTPTGAPLKFSIQGAALGCSIDAKTGLLTIGMTAGSVTVRAAEAQGRSYDEVVVAITARPVPPVPAPPGGAAAPAAPGSGKTSELGEEFANPYDESVDAFA